MPYSGANDPDLPDNVKRLPETQRRQWVAIWNDSFERCTDDGGSDCESVAFRNANGVLFRERISSTQNLHFTVNQIAKVERRTVGGVDYLIAPGVVIKAGVLKGELVPADELTPHVTDWNGRPIVIGHPKNSNDQPISANYPDVLSAAQVGQLFNTYSDNNAIKGELWIEVEKARRVSRGKEVMGRLSDGKPIEVSTAYFRDKVEETGALNGQDYTSVARNLRPDHLAILLDVEGACSWRDGCGTPRVNRSETMRVNVLSKARRPSFDGTETAAWDNVAKTFQAYRDGYYRHTAAERPGADEIPNRVQDAPQAMKDWIASKTLIGDPGADLESDLIAFPVVNPGTNRLNAGGLRGAISRAPQADISESAASSIQSVARDLLESQFETQAANESKITGLLKAIANKLGVNQEDKMDELVSAIMEDGRLKLSEETLRGLDESVLSAVAGLLKATKEQEPEVQERETPTEPAANEDCVPEALATLAGAIEQRGGIEAVFALLDGLRTNEAEHKAKLVAALASNSACMFTKEQLEQLDTGTLETLSRSLSPADYSGQSGGEQSTTKIEPYIMPDVFAARQEVQ